MMFSTSLLAKKISVAVLHGVADTSFIVCTRAHIHQDELVSRQNVNLEKYIGLVTIEANCMIEMINKHVIPSTMACADVIAVHGSGDVVKELVSATKQLQKALFKIEHAGNLTAGAALARTLRLETMVEIRAVVDRIEGVTPASAWTLPTYGELLFLDKTS